MQLRLDESDMEWVRTEANRAGVSPEEFVCRLIRERRLTQKAPCEITHECLGEEQGVELDIDRNERVYFHATKKAYNHGSQIGPFPRCQFHNQSGVNSFINTDLDKDCHKPSGSVDRQRAVYLFDDLNNAIAYTQNQSGWNFYEVKPNKLAGPFPMCLTDLMAKVGAAHTALSSIAKEYWKPTQAWRYTEFLCESAVVIEQVSPPSLVPGAIGRNNLMWDHEIRRKLAKTWGC